MYYSIEKLMTEYVITLVNLAINAKNYGRKNVNIQFVKKNIYTPLQKKNNLEKCFDF